MIQRAGITDQANAEGQTGPAEQTVTMGDAGTNMRMAMVTALGDGDFIVRCMAQEPDGKITVISELDFSAKGIGTALLKEIMSKYGHVRQIELVTDSKPETIAFYESTGFRKLSDLGCTGFMKF